MITDIVIIGGGFGGLEAAFTLKEQLGDRGKITVVDKSRFHAFLPSIHEISSGKISSHSIQIPLETILKPAGMSFVNDRVSRIEPREHKVVLDGNEALHYDYLVLSSGAENDFFNIAGAQKYSCHFRTIADAECIRDNIAELLANQPRPLHVVLAGGGTEGVEVAGEVLDRIIESGHEFELASGDITISLIEGREQILPGFPPAVRDYAAHYLAKRRVKLITGQRITDVKQGSLVLGADGKIPFSLLIWTGGIKPSRLIRELPLPKDKDGWLVVTPQLNSPDDEAVYGVGDVVSIVGSDGTVPLQRLAYHAQDQAIVAALNIVARTQGGKLISYAPRSKPRMISIGRGMGLFVQDDKFRAGSWVVALKKAVERKHLLTCVSRPLLSRVLPSIPGMSLISRGRMLLPF